MEYRKDFFSIRLSGFIFVFCVFIFLPFGVGAVVNTTIDKVRGEGFTCILPNYDGRTPGVRSTTCTKTVTTRNTNIQSNGGLCVVKNTKTFKKGATYMCPFVYFKNQSDGNISVLVDSKLNNYLSKPPFNQNNGWIIDSKDKNIYIQNKKEDHLFYELALVKIDLNRNGRNFSSKEEVISYLQNSDFFEKLGFSGIEKNNSLNYFIPKIESAPQKNFYYLTILSDKAINEISQLNIKPRPRNTERIFFALYPTDVSVKTVGDFVFPKIKNTKGFTVKETGEILVDGMFVFWDK